MNDIALIEKIRTFIFNNCEAFDKLKPFYVDSNLSSSENNSINKAPSPRPITDILGNKMYTYNFTIMSKEYTTDDIDRINNLHFLEQVEEWFEEQSDNGNYPNLAEDIEVTDFYLTDMGFLYENSPESQVGIYQLQGCIKFIKKLNN